MASEINIDKISIEIQAYADAASAPLENLAGSVKALKDAVKGFIGLDKLASGLKQISEIKFSGVDASIGKIADEIKWLKESMEGFAGLGELSTGLQAIQNIDVTTTADNFNRLATAVNAFQNALGDVSKISTLGQALSSLSSGLNSFSDSVRSVYPSLDQVGAASRTAESSVSTFKSSVKRTNPVVWALNAALSGIRKGFVKLGSAIGKTIGGLKNFITHANKSSKSNDNFAKSIFGALKRILLYRILRSMIQSVTRAFVEGSENISLFSKRTGIAMQSLKTDLLYLKNSMGALALPILNVLAPAFSRITDFIVEAANAIGMFIARLTGATSYTRAVRSLVEIGDAATETAKALKDSSTGFDEYNTIAKETSAAGATTDLDVSGMFETVPIDVAVLDFFDKIKDAFYRADFSYLYALGVEIGQKITDGLNGIDWNSIQTWAVKFVTATATFLNGVIENPEFWAALGSTLGNALNTILLSAYTWLNTFNFSAFGTGIANGFAEAIRTIDWNILGKTIGAYFMSIFDTLYSVVTTFPWAELGSNIAQSINSAFDRIDWAKFGKGVSEGFKGALMLLFTIISEIDWYKIGQDVRTFLENIDWVGVWESISKTISAAFKGIGSFISGLFGLTDSDTRSIGTTLAQALNSINWEEALASVGKFIGDALIGILSNLSDFVKEVDWEKLGHAVKEFIVNINWSGIISELAELLGATVGGIGLVIWGLVKDAFIGLGDIWTDLLDEAGGNIILGLLIGIGKAIVGIVVWLHDNVFKPFVDGFLDLFGIHSPSTVFYEFGEMLIQGLLNGIKAVVGLVLAPFETLWNSIKTGAESAWTGITGAFNTAKTWATGVADNIKTGIDTAWTNTKTAAATGWENIKGAFTSVKAWGTGVADDIKSGMDTAWTSAKSNADTAWTNIKGAFTNVKTWFTSNVADNIKSGINAGWDDVKNSANVAWDNVKDAFGGVKSWFESNVGYKIIDALSADWAKDLKSNSESGWAKFKEGFVSSSTSVKKWFTENVSDKIKDAFDSAWATSIKTKASDGLSGLKEGFVSSKTAISSWFSENVSNKIRDAFDSTWAGSLKTKAADGFSKIKDGFVSSSTAVKSWFSTNVGDKIKDAFSGTWASELKARAATGYSNIQAGFPTAGTTIKTWFANNVGKNITAGFQPAWDGLKTGAAAGWAKVKSVFSAGGTVFVGITSGIAKTFKEIVNKLIEGINNLIAIPFNAINSMLNKIRSINILGIQPFVKLWKENPLTAPKIPKLADGGILPNQGQLFVAREGGPEMVGSYGNRTMVANNSQIVDGISDGVAEGMYGANENVVSAILSLIPYLQRPVVIGDREIADANVTGSAKRGVRMSGNPAFSH